MSGLPETMTNPHSFRVRNEYVFLSQNICCLRFQTAWQPLHRRGADGGGGGCGIGGGSRRQSQRVETAKVSVEHLPLNHGCQKAGVAKISERMETNSPEHQGQETHNVPHGLYGQTRLACRSHALSGMPIAHPSGAVCNDCPVSIISSVSRIDPAPRRNLGPDDGES